MFPSTHPRPTQKYMPPQTGKKIKNYIYEYGDLIGKGNFAKVYKGHNLNTQQILAIKLISLDELKCKHLESLVFEEIKILQMMNHPNVLNFFEALLSQRNCYIVTELCNQGSLDDRLKSKIPLSQTELGSIIFDIFNGLQYLRDKGVTHRDLKPANIFIDNDRMKIADFGLAKLFKQRFHDLDIGSPQYMSPQGLILNNYSQKTDIWSFGIIIYEILHGAAPFINCRSQQELIYNITRPIPQNRWKKDINPLLRQMLNKLLDIDEFKRPNILQLAEQPYMRMLIELDREKKVQKQLTHSLSFCGFMALNKNEQGSNQGDRRDFCQFSSRNTKQKAENQQPQSTKGSQNSICKKRFSVGDTPNTEIDYLIRQDQSTQNRFSFSKMSHQSNELQHLQKSTNAHSNRLQIPEKCAYSEGQASNNRNSALMSHSTQKYSLTQNLKTSTLIRLQPMRQQKHTSPFVSRQLFYN